MSIGSIVRMIGKALVATVFSLEIISSWSSIKQKVVSRSSAESEYRGLSNVAAELVCIQILLNELGFSLVSIPLLLCDNISETYLAANSILDSRSKHIEIDHPFIWEKVMQKQLIV